MAGDTHFLQVQLALGTPTPTRPAVRRAGEPLVQPEPAAVRIGRLLGSSKPGHGGPCRPRGGRRTCRPGTFWMPFWLPGHLPLFTARNPSGVRNTGTARPSRSTTIAWVLGQPLAALPHQIGRRFDDAQAHALGIGAEPCRTAGPSIKAVSRSKPSRSATTAPRSVSTGARLTRMVSAGSPVQRGVGGVRRRSVEHGRVFCAPLPEAPSPVPDRGGHGELFVVRSLALHSATKRRNSATTAVTSANAAMASSTLPAFSTLWTSRRLMVRSMPPDQHAGHWRSACVNCA